MKRTSFCLRHVMVSVLLLGGLMMSARAQGRYDFAEANDAGQMLYYTINDSLLGYVTVRGGGSSLYSGALFLPDSVMHEERSYHVTAIGDSSFMSCTSITSVRVPQGVVAIGELAFGGCTKLSEVEVPEGVETIGARAFALLPNLVYAGMAEGAPWGALMVNAYEEDSLFYADASKSVLTGCRRDIVGIRVPNTVRIIGPSALRFCREATSLTLSDGVEEMGEYACGSSDKLKSVVIPSTMELMGAHCFMGSSVEELTVAGAPLSIGDWAFYFSNLKTVELGDETRSIGRNAFSYCTKLDSIAIPHSVTRIDDSAFSYCSSMKKAVLLGEIDTIHYALFDGCTKLEDLNLPASVRYIAGEAFSQCLKLRYLVSENPVPPAVNERTFYMCNIYEVEVPCGSKTAYEATEYWNNYSIYEDCEGVGIGSTGNMQERFVVAPNPAHGEVTVSLPEGLSSFHARLVLRDATGREVR
ncbi:MAG: leucine-rich repeat domain-containing protein, partial [Bacteroidales bacterium]|nr:leucine-rich repeat domain-containing protein [Bacteroidales bacterium]